MKTVRTPDLLTKAGWAWHATICNMMERGKATVKAMGNQKSQKDEGRSETGRIFVHTLKKASNYAESGYWGWD